MECGLGVRENTEGGGAALEPSCPRASWGLGD